MNIFKYIKMRQENKKIEEEFEKALHKQQMFRLDMMLDRLNKSRMHGPGCIIVGNTFNDSTYATQQPIHDNDYDFKSDHHRKFHEWEMAKVNDYINKLEAQF